MPRVADHEERRHQVAAAVGRLIAADGLGAVTVARTAAEAGISVGLVQHYFRSKDEMLLFAYGHVLERFEQRVTALIGNAEAAGTRIEHMVLDALAESMPLDAARRQDWRVALAFAGRAADDRRLGELRTAALRRTRAHLAQAIVNAKECGEVSAEADEHVEAARIAAYTEGLTAHLFADPEGLPPANALAALADHLAGVFSGVCALRDREPGERPDAP
ncbi:TetR/AcrR family transcriptional regulator [Streptomyces silaceus]|uniref:TetR/AcrR family transcriptional regulator n=1 Tax=Streptomyces silaceus TaxID=545123 RepID=UPI0006EBD385|nr:TetR/AcrR family transcriptional regulator [Streptomyces silaceus]